MSKRSKETPIDRAQFHLSAATVKAAEGQFNSRPVDNSPTLDIGVFKVVLEQVSALELGALSRKLMACTQEFPLLIEATYNRPLESTREGYLMAVSFEAGRRYAMLQAMQLLSEEVDTFSDEKISGDTRPLLAM
jgi:hypothetical protein